MKLIVMVNYLIDSVHRFPAYNTIDFSLAELREICKDLKAIDRKIMREETAWLEGNEYHIADCKLSERELLQTLRNEEKVV